MFKKMERIAKICSHSSCFISVTVVPPLLVPYQLRYPKVFSQEYLEAKVKELEPSGNDYVKAKRMYLLDLAFIIEKSVRQSFHIYC